MAKKASFLILSAIIFVTGLMTVNHPVTRGVSPNPETHTPLPQTKELGGPTVSSIGHDAGSPIAVSNVIGGDNTRAKVRESERPTTTTTQPAGATTITREPEEIKKGIGD